MRSLRGRLALGVLITLAAVLAVAGVSISRYVDHSERNALDDRLRRTAELSRETAVNAVAQGLPENDKRLDAVLSATGTSLRLVLGDATLLSTGERPPKPSRPLQLGLHTVTVHGEHYRTYVSTLRNKDLGGLAKLELTTSLRGLEHRQSQLEHRLELLGLAALVAGTLLAGLAAELVLRPLRRLRAVASSIAGDEDLGRRVEADHGPTEVRSLAASMDAMLGRLQRSSRERERALEATRRFAADAGHELRTPMTSIQAVLDLLRRHRDLDADRRDGLLADAQAEQARLVALIDGLQALARGDARRVELQPVDLAELVGVVVEDARRRAGGGRVREDVPDGPVVVQGWEPGLRSLAENLVVNALRHGREDGEVAVTLRGPGDGAAATLVVEDDGPGVPQEQRERIFEPFARLDGTRSPGSGLGLALVAQQADHHGASVAIDDSPLGGARFVVRFTG